MKKDIIEAVTDALLIVMAGDILYLYFIGRWYEPCLPILIIELTILSATIVFAIWRFVRYIKRPIISSPLFHSMCSISSLFLVLPIC